MKSLVLTGVGLPGATLLGVLVWVLRVSHETPHTSVHAAQLLHGVDEYWNGDFPEGVRQ